MLKVDKNRETPYFRAGDYLEGIANKESFAHCNSQRGDELGRWPLPCGASKHREHWILGCVQYSRW
jgi:hypothetical protein